MKTLLLMRHGKSGWDDPAAGDHERCLTPRGRAAAAAMAQWLHQHSLVPDEVRTSSAQRAMQTAQLVCDTLQLDAPILHAPLYLPSVDTMLGELTMAGGDVVLLVSHNPACEVFVEQLTGELRAMPTAAIAVIDFDVSSWSDIVLDRRGELRLHQRPKAL